MVDNNAPLMSKIGRPHVAWYDGKAPALQSLILFQSVACLSSSLKRNSLLVLK